MKKFLIIVPTLLLIAFLFLPFKKNNKLFLEDNVSTHSSSIKKVKKAIQEKKNETITEKKEELPKLKEVETILAATNLWEDLKSIDGLMEDRLDKARELLPPEEYEKLEKVIQESFSSAKFIESVKKYLAENLTQDDLDELKKLTEDPFMKKVWEIQNNASSPEGQKEMMDFAKDFSPSPEREKLIADYEEQTQATNRMLDLNRELLKGIFKGAAPKDISPEQLKMVTDKITETIKPSIEKEVRLRFHYTYQDLTDQELRRLKELDKNPALTRTENLVHEKLKELLFQGGGQMGKMHKGTRI